MTEARRRWLRRAPWLLVSLPGLGQMYLLLAAVFNRWSYPYDLEWMEGGMLVHALRIADGRGIYVEPSVEFIPYLYTPLYPALLAALEPMFGLSYAVARAINALCLLGIGGLVTWALVRFSASGHRAAAVTGAIAALGLTAATYPWVDGWYDIARGDTLFLLMVCGGLVGVCAWARDGHGWRGHGKVAAAGALLGLSFFCKQTGVLYVAAGGAILLVANWRRVPVYVAVTGAIGLGGTWLLSSATGGWFWTYAFEVHQAHDCNQGRFTRSFGLILWRYPAMTAVIAIALCAVAGTWLATRRRPVGATPLLVAAWVFAVSCVVGAVGWATQWAHFNAYIPAMLAGGVAAGAALPALMGCAEAWGGRRLGQVAALAAAAGLAIQLVSAWWSPARFVPRAEDRARGDRLIETLGAIEGDVLVPFHPWYAHLAGKPVFVHRMGVMDVSYRQPLGKPREQLCFWARGLRPEGPPPPWPVRGLRERLEAASFAAIIWDNKPVDPYWPGLKRSYRLDDYLPGEAQPRVYTGADVVPREIWVPAEPGPVPAGARIVFDFEAGGLDGWEREGKAWGGRPVTRPLRDQGAVRRYRGRAYLSSMHGGDEATGTLRSPGFRLEGSRLSVRLSGGAKPETLRVELWVGDEMIGAVSPEVSSERMSEQSLDIAAARGRDARLVLIDADAGAWGHLNVDEVWLWE